MSLTVEEARAAKERAEQYPKGIDPGAWGYGPLESRTRGEFHPPRDRKVAIEYG